jgi:hypothetical protein
MHYAALGAGQADVFQTRSSSLRTRVKDVVTRAAPVTSAVGKDVRDMGIDGDCQP